jgi:hypothetical protein
LDKIEATGAPEGHPLQSPEIVTKLGYLNGKSLTVNETLSMDAANSRKYFSNSSVMCER